MRDGVLLAEESPLDLMQRCQCSNLEDAFLFLSKKQDIGIGANEVSLNKLFSMIFYIRNVNKSFFMFVMEICHNL